MFCFAGAAGTGAREITFLVDDCRDGYGYEEDFGFGVLSPDAPTLRYSAPWDEMFGSLAHPNMLRRSDDTAAIRFDCGSAITVHGSALYVEFGENGEGVVPRSGFGNPWPVTRKAPTTGDPLCFAVDAQAALTVTIVEWR